MKPISSENFPRAKKGRVELCDRPVLVMGEFRCEVSFQSDEYARPGRLATGIGGGNLNVQNPLETMQEVLDAVIVSRDALHDSCKTLKPGENDAFLLALADVVEGTVHYLVRLQSALDHQSDDRKDNVAGPGL